MHGLQACLFKYITIAASTFMLSMVKMPLKGEVGGQCILKIVIEITLLIIESHGKIMELFLNLCGNPERDCTVHVP